MAYGVNTGTGMFYAPTFSASDFGLLPQTYQSSDIGSDPLAYSQPYGYLGSDPFWQQAFGYTNNYQPTFGEDGSLQSLMVKSGDKTGTVFDYGLQNGQYSPTGQYNQTWDTGNSFQNMALGSMAALGLGSNYLAGNLGGPDTANMWASADGVTGGGAAATGGTAPGATMEQMIAGSATGSGGGMNLLDALGGAGKFIGNNASWLLPTIGALGGASASTSPQTTTQSTQLPSWLQALGPQFAGAASNLAQTPYPGQAGFNQDQYAAFQQYRDQASSPLLGATSQQLQSTLNGDFLKPESNPYLKGIADQTSAAVSGNVNSAFNKGGAWGGSANQEMLTKNLADANNNLYFNNYNQERGRQMTAAGLAPSVNASQALNTSNLLGAGNQQQQFAQQGLEGPFNWGMKQLGAYGAPFGFNQGSTTTQTQPGPSAFQNILGGLFAGGGLFNMGKDGGWWK